MENNSPSFRRGNFFFSPQGREVCLSLSPFKKLTLFFVPKLIAEATY